MNQRRTTKASSSSASTPRTLLPSQVALKEFRIIGLHDEKDLILKFQTGVRILVADNGSGKTTLLSTLYAILEGDFHKLGWLDFKEIVLKFFSGDEVTLLKEEIPNPLKWADTEHAFIIELKRYLPGVALREVALAVEKSRDDDEFRENISPSLRRQIIISPFGTASVFRNLREIRDAFNSKRQAPGNLRAKWKKIKENFNFHTIYMPTYRRVEEDIRNLGLSSKYRKDQNYVESRHIFFGMADVKETFERITNEIRQSTSETFRAVSSKVIDELLVGGMSSVQTIDISRLKDQEAISLVLKRLGKALSPARMRQLTGFINNPNNADSDSRMLLYLLNNFFGIYETQIEKDRQIKSFISVTNRYLVNKELRYDEVNISIKAFSTFTDHEIDLEKLSSGEKQIVSILSKLYLSPKESFAVIIDEPELSLSIEWQRTLLPDILNSGHCKFLLAATHSPFIFENDLEKHTSALLTRRKN